MARYNKIITITAGTPTRLSDLATAATAGERLPPQLCINFQAQMMHGGSGLGYLFLGIPNGKTPSYPTDGQISCELSPASATAPGGLFYQNQQAFGSPLAGTLDLTRTWIDGSNSADQVLCTWDTQQ